MKRLVFKSVPDSITRAAMLKRGEVDVAYLLEVPQAQELPRDPTVKLAFSGGIASFFLDFLDQWIRSPPGPTGGCGSPRTMRSIAGR